MNMISEQMLKELERARKMSLTEHRTIWALSNGRTIAITEDPGATKRALERLGYWVCSIFENGKRVET